ncbi:SIMPL domain-containing protein [Cystobacter fuscus]
METRAPLAQAAADANAKKMDKVIAALVQAGVVRKDLETRNYSVAMEFEPPVPGTSETPKPRGYQVNNTVQVHVRDLTKVGPLLDTALKAGANRVDSVRFGLSKPETGRDGALRDAVARARQSAQVLATALGVKLGPVLDASTITEPIRPMPLARFAMATAESADVATPIQPQEQTVQATVTLIYAIEK